jgi:hypothetical protein
MASPFYWPVLVPCALTGSGAGELGVKLLQKGAIGIPLTAKILPTITDKTNERGNIQPF